MKIFVAFILIVAMIPALMAGKRREGSTAGYNCNVDPQGQNWSHLTLVTNWDHCTATCQGTYDLGSTEMSAGDTSWTDGGASWTTDAAQSSPNGLQIDTTAGQDKTELTTNIPLIIDSSTGRMGYWLSVTDGAGVGCATGNAVGFMVNMSVGGFSLWTTIEGDAANGWNLKLLHENGTSGTVNTVANDVLNDGQDYFIEVSYDETIGLNDELILKIDGQEVSKRTGSLRPLGEGTVLNRIRIFDFVGNCPVQSDDLWISTDPSFDIFNHVVTEGCTDKPI